MTNLSSRRKFNQPSLSVDQSPWSGRAGAEYPTTHASRISRQRPLEHPKGGEAKSPSFAREYRYPSDAEGDKDALSSASTPVKTTKSFGTMLRWSASAEIFHLGEGVKLRKLDFRTVLPILEDRLYFQAVGYEPRQQAGVHYFTMDKVMRYVPFCADFGPFNLGMTHYFCATLRELLLNPRLTNSKLILYTSTAASDITNAIYLIGAFLCLHLGATPQEAWTPFSKISNCPCIPYRDATWVPSSYDLHVIDCWAGLLRAVSVGLYSMADFDKDEYFYYDHPTNGDMHEVVKGKFFAFKGPTGKRKPVGFGRYTLLPTDYCDVFRSKGIRTVIRLNDKEYDRAVLVQHGFHHHDLFFVDCSTPSDTIVDKFLRIAETSEGALAVHCLAGLGRTGTLIAMYMMKHLGFTANEAMAWLRICRPGSVIGPQQAYLQQQQERMHALGRRRVAGLGLAGGEVEHSSQGGDKAAEELAQMVSKGMANRDCARIGSSEGAEGAPEERKDAVAPGRTLAGRRAGGAPKKEGAILPVQPATDSGGRRRPAGRVKLDSPGRPGGVGDSGDSKQLTGMSKGGGSAMRKGSFSSPPAGPGVSAARLLRGGSRRQDL